MYLLKIKKNKLANLHIKITFKPNLFAILLIHLTYTLMNTHLFQERFVRLSTENFFDTQKQ